MNEESAFVYKDSSAKINIKYCSPVALDLVCIEIID
jgi:hypothetical protein